MEVWGQLHELAPAIVVCSFVLRPGSVFSVALDPLGKMAVSGGEDERACVWRVDTQELIFVCEGERKMQ